MSDLILNFIKALRDNNTDEIDKIIYIYGFGDIVNKSQIIQYFDELFPNKTKYIIFILHYMTCIYTIKSKKLFKKLDFPRTYYHLVDIYGLEGKYNKMNYYLKKYWKSNKNINLNPTSSNNFRKTIYYDLMCKNLSGYNKKCIIFFILNIKK